MSVQYNWNFYFDRSLYFILCNYLRIKTIYHINRIKLLK